MPIVHTLRGNAFQNAGKSLSGESELLKIISIHAKNLAFFFISFLLIQAQLAI